MKINFSWGVGSGEIIARSALTWMESGSSFPESKLRSNLTERGVTKFRPEEVIFSWGEAMENVINRGFVYVYITDSRYSCWLRRTMLLIFETVRIRQAVLRNNVKTDCGAGRNHLWILLTWPKFKCRGFFGMTLCQEVQWPQGGNQRSKCVLAHL